MEVDPLIEPKLSGSRDKLRQWNLFTGELEPIPESPKPEPQPETQWLFDPDFRLVLPEDVAGREIVLVSGDRFRVPEKEPTPRT